jgi:hypothetical protein
MDCCTLDGGSFLLRVRKVPVAEFTEQEKQSLYDIWTPGAPPERAVMRYCDTSPTF